MVFSAYKITTQDQPSCKRLLTNIKDGEPYELPLIKLKTNAIELLNKDVEHSVLTIEWDSEFYYADLSFSSALEEKLIKSIEKNLSSSIETRLKLAKTLAFFLNCFSCVSIKDKVLPLFATFCNDTHWGIRKICALEIGSLLALTPSSLQSEVLSLYSLLANDTNPLVFQSAYSSLGKFIYFFPVWNEFLIDQAVLLSKSTFSQSVDLAAYLPGICRKFLSHKEKVIEILIFLLENPQSSVRAKAVGVLEFFIRNLKTDFCKKIVPIYTNLLRDLDIVKIKAIRTLPFLLQNIENSLHSSFFGTFRRIQTHTNNWRVNHMIAGALVSIARNLSVYMWIKELWNVGIALCHDKAEVVRIKAAKAMGFIVKDTWGINVEEEQKIKNDLKDMLIESYKIRATLAYISGICVEITFFDDIFLRLCQDQVVNVRIACGVVARKYKIQRFVNFLAKDLEKDVKDSLGHQKTLFINNDCVLVPCKYQYITPGFLIVYNNNEGNQEKNSFNGEQINKEIRLNKGYCDRK